MKKSLSFVCAGLTILNCFSLFGQNSNTTITEKDVIPANAYEAVMKYGNSKIIHESGDDDYVLLPECEFKDECISNRVEKDPKNYPFVSEMIYKINKAELKKSASSENNKYNVAEVSRIFRSISKMKGMTYYSTTRRKRMTLYENAFAINNPESQIAVNDDIEGSADGKSLFAILKDATFGKNIYKLSYRENENTLYVQITNMDSMGLGLVRAIRPNDLIMNVIVVDCGDNFVIYLGIDTDCSKFPGIKTKIEDSFVSRLDAIYDWFLKQF